MEFPERAETPAKRRDAGFSMFEGAAFLVPGRERGKPEKTRVITATASPHLMGGVPTRVPRLGRFFWRLRFTQTRLSGGDAGGTRGAGPW